MTVFRCIINLASQTEKKLCSLWGSTFCNENLQPLWCYWETVQWIKNQITLIAGTNINPCDAVFKFPHFLHFSTEPPFFIFHIKYDMWWIWYCITIFSSFKFGIVIFCPKKTDNFLLDILALSVKYDNHQGTDYLNINRTLEPWSP